MRPGESEFIPADGKRGGYCVEIAPENYPVEGCYRVTVWTSSYGQGIQTPIRTLSKARRIARFLYATYLPEHQAEEAAKSARYSEMDASLKERWAEQEAERVRVRAERLAKITADTPRVELAVCPSCDYTCEPDEFEQPVYECSRCGGTQVGAENRTCDTDHIFMARVGDLACPSCEDALEETPALVTGVVVDGEFIPEAEIEEVA